MRINLPTYSETFDLDRVDAFLRRDGALVPLRLAHDPRDARAAETPAAPSSAALAPAALNARESADAERIAAAHRAIAPVAAVRERVDAADLLVAPIAAAVARQAPTPIVGRLVGPEREAALGDVPAMDPRDAELLKIHCGDLRGHLDAARFAFAGLAERLRPNPATEDDEFDQSKEPRK